MLSLTLVLACLCHKRIKSPFTFTSNQWKVTHWAIMMAVCFWEATFGYKSYHFSDCYRLYISCKNNKGKALNYQTDLSDWYQLYISCKINIEIPITLSNWYETIRSIFFMTDDGYSCNHADWVVYVWWKMHLHRDVRLSGYLCHMYDQYMVTHS